MLNMRKVLILKNRIFNSKIVQYCNVANQNLEEWHKIKSKYSAKQQAIIFNTLKQRNDVEMKKYGISESQMEKIETLQNDKNVFNSLDDFITLDVINISQMENICSSIVPKKEKKSFKKTSIVTPPLSIDTLEKLKIVLGLRIRASHISWSQVELTGSNCNILKWDSQSISDLPPNASLAELISIGKNIAKTIPEADAYVMEKESTKPIAKINTSILRLLLRQEQLLSIILTILSTRKTENQSNENFFDSFYTLRSLASAHLFGLFLGNETVSATDSVDALLQQKNVKLKNITSVRLENDYLKYYVSLDQYRKEEVNRSLLVALTFFESVVLDRI